MNFYYILLLVLILITVKTNKYLNYKVKLIGYYVIVSFLTSLHIPYFLLRPRNILNLHDVSRTLRHVKKLYGLECDIKGHENLKEEKSAVVVANHQSSLDIFAMFDIWICSNKMSILAKRELIWLGGTFGIAAWLGGMKFINRSAGGKAGDAMNRAMLEMKEKNEKLWVFPEGTRRNTGEIHEFKKGAFHAAIHAQVPIIPVVYHSYRHIFDSSKRLFRCGKIYIEILPEISTEGLTKNDVDELITKTRQVMIKVYGKKLDENSNKSD